MRQIHHQRGFHLIELLITLALISIMSNWMLSHYENTIAAARRQEAQQALIRLASALEDYALQHRSYSGATLHRLHFQENRLQQYYEFHIQSTQAQHYWIAARPIGKQRKNDLRCGTLLLSASGEKKISGRGKLNECWTF